MPLWMVYEVRHNRSAESDKSSNQNLAALRDSTERDERTQTKRKMTLFDTT